MGLAINEFRITHSMALNDRFDRNASINRHIDALLPLLPRGTVCKEVYQNAIVDLSLTHSIVFEHPLFDGIPQSNVPPITRIEVDQVRTCWRNGEDRIEEDTILLGIRYLTSSGQNRFSS